MQPHSHFDRFLTRVHARLILVRALERAGACTGIASIFACLFATVLLFRGRDALALSLATLAVGAIAGLLWGLAQRPSRFDAAREADRQLDLADLLATALHHQDDSDPWHLTVRATADARCRALAPSAIILHRLGGRAWGGIGLAAALCVTLGLLSATPRDTRADRAATAAHIEHPADPHAYEAAATRPPAANSVTAARSQEDPASRADLDGAESTTATEPSDDIDNNDPAARRTPDSSTAGARTGETSPPATSPPPPHAPDAAGRRAPDAAASANPVSGGGAPTNSSTRSPDASAASNSTAARHTPEPAAPPWTAPSWPAARDAAGQAIQSGRVPDAYRDVVREYFDTGN